MNAFNVDTLFPYSSHKYLAPGTTTTTIPAAYKQDKHYPYLRENQSK